MCGIAGWAGKVPQEAREAFEAFATQLLIETQSRGEHATGVAAYAGPNKRHVGKGPVDAKRFVKTPVWKKALESLSAIGHCRWATHGSPTKNENNHPFESGKWSMIHNGVIGGHRYIAEKEGVRLVSECDSEVILRVFARGVKMGGPVAGLQRWVDASKDLHARYAIAILDHTNGAIRLLRDSGSPCSIVKLPALGIVAFASTSAILKAAMEHVQREYPGFPLLDGAEGWECEEGKVYVLSPKTLEVEHERLNWPRQRTFGFGTYNSSKPTSGELTQLNSDEPEGDSENETVYCCTLCGRAEIDCMCEAETRPQ
jgi:glutamine phosphoribosylpyrophosphate amidotransferase